MTQWTASNVYYAQQKAIAKDASLRLDRSPRCRCGGNINNGRCKRCGKAT